MVRINAQWEIAVRTMWVTKFFLFFFLFFVLDSEWNLYSFLGITRQQYHNFFGIYVFSAEFPF